MQANNFPSVAFTKFNSIMYYVYTELQSAVHAMIQRLEYSFTFNPSLLTSPKRKKQVAEILTEAEKYIWRIKEEMRCA